MSDSHSDIALRESWNEVLLSEFSKDYMSSLMAFLQKERKAGKEIFPPEKDIFAALNHISAHNVKVVILGQDPYHGPGQAHGLCFSVRPDVKVPPSLINIYKELGDDLSITQPGHGCLLPWADQGVLLLNAVLTVEAHKAGSHQGKGWEKFTDHIISELNRSHDHIVFILWGSYAQKKGAKIDHDRHLILSSPHPSPLSSYRGFFGSKVFSKTNAYLTSHGKSPINWQLPEASEIII